MIENVFIMPHPPIIVPSIGRGNAKAAQKTIEGCRAVADSIAGIKPETIIILSPHGPSYSDVICISGDPVLKGDFGNFGKPGQAYEFNNDLPLARDITQRLNANGTFAVLNDETSRQMYRLESGLDHGALVPLHFIKEKYDDFNLVHISTGIPDPAELYQVGMVIQDAVAESGKNVIFIASGDMSHRLAEDGPYGFDPLGPVYDKKIVSYIKDRAFVDLLMMDDSIRNCAGECGHRSITIALGIMEGYDCKSRVYSYEGPFGVGYMVAAISAAGSGRSVLSEFKEIQKKAIETMREGESKYVRLARNTIELYIKEGKVLVPEEYSRETRGTFVSIKKFGRLRGCIGTTGPTQASIEKEIIDNAIKAATADPRFGAIEEDELNDLIISVDVLYPPESIESMDELDAKEYGVIVSKGHRRGLLLPNLDGIDTVEEQVKIALDKGGIDPSEEYEMERFRVERYK